MPDTDTNLATAPAQALRSEAQRLTPAQRGEVADRLIAAVAPSVQALGGAIADGASVAAALSEGRDVPAAPAGAITLGRAFLEQPGLARKLHAEWRGVVVQLGAARSAEEPGERLELAVLAAERASGLAGRVVALDPSAGGSWLDGLRGALRDAGAFLGRVADRAADFGDALGTAVGTGAGVTLVVGGLVLWWLFKGK